MASTTYWIGDMARIVRDDADLGEVDPTRTQKAAPA